MKWGYEISSEDKEHIEEDLFTDKAYIELNENEPYFVDDEKVLEGFSYLDDLHRCGVAFACIKNNTLSIPHNKSNSPDKRPKIHSKPSGFPKSKEENTVNKRLVFQRCHLIGYNLFINKDDKGKENANLKKIFTGTRFMNNVMFYYEKKIYDYVYETENHVLYRVTPYFKGSNEVVYGVEMEAKFINEKNEEDKKLSFNVFVYNKQPCIKFDYKTGKIFTDKSKDLSKKMLKTERKYIINEKNKRFHLENCASVYDMKSIKEVTKKGEDLIQEKYCPCGICIPY